MRVIVMGGTSGIGLAAAELLTAAGAEVIVTGRDPEKLAAVKDRVAVAEQVDGTDEEQVAAFLERTGPVDHLVLAFSGGAGAFGPVRQVGAAAVLEAFTGKVIGYLTALRHAQVTGSVTLVSAASARAALPGTAVLAAANGAVERMVGPLAVELAPVRVNVVSPGVVDTPWWSFLPAEQRAAQFAAIADQLPTGRVGVAEDVAQAIAYLVGATQVTGTVLPVDGGRYRRVVTFSARDVIMAKRDRARLSDEQIDWVVAAYTRGDVADEQMSALAMAILLNGMDASEIARWTQAMIDSGEVLEFGDLGRPLVDKHSTGGVGDKITLPLAPLVAACGAAVPQLSGRGLGHTGGTLDKLESIPGWRASLSLEEITAQLADVGAVICATTPTLAPADRKLYALRDVTGTVEAIPLIASSIMSKKIAEGTSGLVLDVKVGSGAFMKTAESARELAETMVALGGAHGLATTALLTDMTVPLGRAIGNALEVEESVAVLRGGGPADVVELTVALAREMLALAKIDIDPAAVLASGEAYAVWERMIAAQGGDPSAPLPVATHVEELVADRSGYASFDALAVGVAAWRLGAGRARKEDAVQAGAGVRLLVDHGAPVEAGQPLLELHTDTPEAVAGARALLTETVSEEEPAQRRLQLDTIRG